MSIMPQSGRARKWLIPALACLVACSSPDAPAPTDFVAAPKYFATDASFEGFRAWERHPLSSPTLPVQAIPGPAFVYASRRPEPGARRWPVGSILVKTVEPSDDPRDWTVHAMVKRHERFNPEGAVGWEFFALQLDAEGAPTILWRSDGHNDGHAYGASTMMLPTDHELSCNDCHALRWQTDAVLTPSLSLVP